MRDFTPKNSKKKPAFTLAEVLITLGIIGVVAAMTIPTLIQNYHKKVTLTRLKESYSIMQQAVKLSQEDNGGIDGWNMQLSGENFFQQYFAQYLKLGKSLSTTNLKSQVIYKQLNGSNYTGTTYNNSTSYHFILLNGSMVTFNLNSANETGLWVGIDVNGLEKPNTIGKDTFLFFISSEYGLQPLGGQGTPNYWKYGDYTKAKITTSSNLACNKKYSGYWCAAFIINEGWTIGADYPWK